MEDIFDNNDVAGSPKVAPSDDEVEECSIGTEEDPKVIKISKNLTQESKEKYIKLMKEFMMYLLGLMMISKSMIHM